MVTPIRTVDRERTSARKILTMKPISAKIRKILTTPRKYRSTAHEMDEDMKGTDPELIDFPLSRDIQYNTASTFKFDTCQFTKLSEAYEVGFIHVERILLVELWANIAVHEVFFLHGT